MRQTDLTQTEEFHKGQRAEDAIAFILRLENYFVTITADNKERGQSGAPGMRDGNEFLTLPDILASMDGHSAWAEVKGKTEPTYTYITQRYEHGIGQRKWQMYRSVQQQTGLPVYLYIYELESGTVLFNHINDLYDPDNKEYDIENCGINDLIYQVGDTAFPIVRFYNGNVQDRGGMIYFPRCSFGIWGTIRENDGQLGLFDEVHGSGDKIYRVWRNITTA